MTIIPYQIYIYIYYIYIYCINTKSINHQNHSRCRWLLDKTLDKTTQAQKLNIVSLPRGRWSSYSYLCRSFCAGSTAGRCWTWLPRSCSSCKLHIVLKLTDNCVRWHDKPSDLGKNLLTLTGFAVTGVSLFLDRPVWTGSASLVTQSFKMTCPNTDVWPSLAQYKTWP